MNYTLALASLIFLAFTNCTKKEEASAPPTTAPAAATTTATAQTAVIRGTVTAKGKGTAPEAVRMSADKYCADFWKGKKPTLTKVEAGETGWLKGAVVYLKNAPQGPANTTPVELDQKGCLYEPTVVAVQTNQPLIIKNSDTTMHNVHGLPKSNPEFNFGQATSGASNERKFAKAETGIKVKCDVHGWMAANVSVFDHPFFAVTDDKGAFEIKGIPEGKYELEAYHPALGTKALSLDVSCKAPNTALLEF